MKKVKAFLIKLRNSLKKNKRFSGLNSQVQPLFFCTNKMIDLFKNERIFEKVKDYTLSNAVELAKKLLIEEVIHEQK